MITKVRTVVLSAGAIDVVVAVANHIDDRSGGTGGFAVGARRCCATSVAPASKAVPSTTV